MVGRRRSGCAVADARHHLHVIGATGSGKSTLLARLILDDIRAAARRRGHRPQRRPGHRHLARLPAPARARAIVHRPRPAPGRHRASTRSPPPCHAAHQRRPAAVRRRTGGDVAVENLVSIFRRVFAALLGAPHRRPPARGLPDPARPTRPPLPRPTSPACSPTRWCGPGTCARCRIRCCAGSGHSYERMSDPARAQLIAPLMNKMRGAAAAPVRPRPARRTPTPHAPPAGAAGADRQPRRAARRCRCVDMACGARRRHPAGPATQRQPR